MLLLGVLIYIGLGVLEVEYEDLHWQELAWFSPSRALKQQYVLGASVFLGALVFFYYFFKFPQKFASRRLAKWPPLSTNFVYAFLIASGVLMVMVAAGPRIPVLSAVLVNVSHKVCVFAAVFAFVHWWRTKSLFALFLFIGVFASSAMFSMIVFSGRRLLLSVMCVPVVCYYWQVLRYKSPMSNVMKVAAIAGVLLIVSTSYSAIRHFNKGVQAQETERTVTTVLNQIQKLKWQSVISPLRKNILHYGAQYCGYYSLLTLRYIDDRQLELEPLQSLKWIAAYPVPRQFWSDKPQTIGIRIVTVSDIPGKTNWGIGIVGHGFLEGGYAVLVLYAALIVLTVRIIDTPLKCDPGNPFLMGVLCTAAPHVICWVRGDIAILWIEIIETLLFAIALGIVGRIIFGRDRSRFPGAGANRVALPAGRPLAPTR